eukprot:2010002-Rhodomonas_salina.2
MGTWKIVDCPLNCTPLPGVWSYSVKQDSNGIISKYKARWCARRDMQMPWEYNNTYSPTSRFAAVSTVIATAAQEGMDLHHWDIQGAFCTSDVDTEIFMQPPTGYPLPDGQCLKLCKSLYGLLQSSALFYENLEHWMLDYGFTLIGQDGVMFRLDRGSKRLIVSLYVND